jgi:Flp pilus assembly protein TadG
LEKLMMRLRGKAKSSMFGVRNLAPQTSNSALRSDKRVARGAVQIEFALTILVVIFVTFWMWELVMMTYTMNVLSDSAKEGTRYAIVHGLEGSSACSGSPDTTAIVSRVQDFAKMSLHSMAGMTVTVSYQGSCNLPGNWVRVVIAYPFVPYINLPVNYTLHAASEGRIVF